MVFWLYWVRFSVPFSTAVPESSPSLFHPHWGRQIHNVIAWNNNTYYIYIEIINVFAFYIALLLLVYDHPQFVSIRSKHYKVHENEDTGFENKIIHSFTVLFYLIYKKESLIFVKSFVITALRSLSIREY